MKHCLNNTWRPVLVGTALLFLIVCESAALNAQSTTNAPSSASAPGSGSLLSNGDFQLATADPTWPDDWPKGAGITWETDSGKHFLRLVSQKPGQHLMAYREIPIPPGIKNVQVTIRYRTSGISPGVQNWMDARAIFHFIDDSRKVLSPDPGPMDFSSDAADWTVASAQYAVPAGATKMMLMPSLFMVAAGTLDLAEVDVTAAP